MTDYCNESGMAGLGAAHGYAAPDPVNHPKHYTQHPSGVECIQVTECMNFCLGNAVKYIWRADLKNDAIEDLEKARWYVSREIERRKRHNAGGMARELAAQDSDNSNDING